MQGEKWVEMKFAENILGMFIELRSNSPISRRGVWVHAPPPGNF